MKKPLETVQSEERERSGITERKTRQFPIGRGWAQACLIFPSALFSESEAGGGLNLHWSNSLVFPILARLGFAFGTG